MGKKIAAGMSDEEPRRLVFYKEDIERITSLLTVERRRLQFDLTHAAARRTLRRRNVETGRKPWESSH